MTQREVISATVFATPVSPCLVALACRNITVIFNGDVAVSYFSMTLSNMRMRSTRFVTGQQVSNVFRYSHRPAGLECTTMKDYFHNFYILPVSANQPKGSVLYGTSDYNNEHV